jgi:hypothetical protein
MAKEITELIQKNPSYNKSNSALIGNLANSISLETKISTINRIGTKDVKWKVQKFKPTYYVSLGIEPDILHALFDDYNPTLVGEFDVYRNYHAGQKVSLFELRSKTNQ